MTHDGYLAFGGNEVINSERVRGYSQTANCPMFWLKGAPCSTLSEAVGDFEYNYQDIASAPWYDSTAAEISTRFFGAYGLEISGVEDSTRVASVTEGIDDGGMIGRARRATRNVKVRTLLLGQGQDAVEYGMSWLSRVLDPDGCGQLSEDCGTAEMTVFSSCPPERRMVPGYTEWVESRRNLVTNPIMANSSTGWAAFSGTLTPSANGLGVTVNNSGTTPVLYQSPRAAGQAGQKYFGSINVRAEGGSAVTMFLRVLTNSTGNPTISESAHVELAPGESVSLHALPSIAAPAGTTQVFLQVWAEDILSGQTLWISDALLTPSDGFSPYFDGSSPSSELVLYSWTGTAGASISIEQTRTSTMVPETDEAYQERVNETRRYMRNTGTISGPFKINEIESNGFWAYEAQFVLAGGPSILGVTKALELGPTLPTVIQDVPYNLVPYPSAELAAGSIVTATNLSTNPSVEVNATGWVGESSSVSGTSPAAFVTSGRSTDIGAGGSSASFRTRLLGNNGSTPVNASVALLDALQDVAIPAGTNRRISLNIWVAALILNGSSPGTLINGVSVTVEFFNGVTSLAPAQTLASASPAEFGGRAYSSTKLLVPATATKVRVRGRANVTWTSSATAAQNSDIRLYADALTVSIP